jgi:curved DNA-binding protein CbpA
MSIQDPFAALGLPRRFSIDSADVERRYLAAVAEMHPDLMSHSEALGALGEDNIDVDAKSSALNEARRTLEDPERRAIALWKLLGGKDDPTLPPGFLMEMMEVREAIEAGVSGPERAKWEAWVEDRRRDYTKAVGELFLRIERGEPAPDHLRQIKLQLNAWRYIERLAEQL